MSEMVKCPICERRGRESSCWEVKGGGKTKTDKFYDDNEKYHHHYASKTGSLMRCKAKEHDFILKVMTSGCYSDPECNRTYTMDISEPWKWNK